MAEEKMNSDSKNIKPIVKIDQSKVRKSTGRQFLDSFITHDMGIVKDYLIDDILIPAIKDTIVDTICSAVNMIFKGSPGKGSSSRRWNSNPNRTDYGSIYRTTDTGIYRRDDRRDEPQVSRRSTMDYMDIPFNNRADAEAVLEQMRDILEQYPSVSVADFYELVGYNYGSNWTCHDFGWTDLSGVIVTWSHGAWIIALPKAVPIK
jgi:hypothetical protein